MAQVAAAVVQVAIKLKGVTKQITRGADDSAPFIF